MMQLASKRIHSGRVISVDVDTVRFPDGSTGELEIVRHPGAAAVLPFASDPRGADPTILLIEQYRYAANGPLIEIPAGRLNPGEAPEVCARRKPLSEVLQLIRDGVICDAKTVLCILFMAGFVLEH